MTIKEFIEKAEASWQNKVPYEHKLISANRYWAVFEDANGSSYTIAIEVLLLNPETWKAVGRTEGWKDTFDIAYKRQYDVVMWEETISSGPRSIYYMHRMIDSLAEGKTIEEFIRTL